MSKNKKKKYTKEQIKFVTDLVKGGTKVTPASRVMCKKYGIDHDDSIGRYFRKKMQQKGITNNVLTPEDTEDFKQASTREYDNKLKRFIVTWGQVDTDIHEGFFDNMLAYAEHINAGVHVIAGRYKNPTSLTSSKAIKASEKNMLSWDKRLKPYLDAKRQNIHKLLTICADIKIQPTAVTPLTGLNGLTALESCIIGHPRVHLDSLPVLEGYPNKIICTTGSVTKENYTDTKSGKLGEFHHQYGFVVVELDGENYHIRQVQADDDGTFYDLKYRVTNGEVIEYKESPLAIVFGDLHLGEENKQAVETSFEIVKDLNIKKIVLHDIFDGKSISHHDINNPFELLKKERDGTNSLKRELKYMVNWLKDKPYEFVVVRSNHDDFLDRFLTLSDWRKVGNKFEYLKYANILASGKAPKGIIPYILEKKFKNVTALDINDSYRIGEYECGMHGHIGINGARSNLNGFSKLNTNSITGHSHTCRRINNTICVGTLTNLRLGYNKGASSWIHANAIIYPNGKASLVNIVKGKYTTLY